MQQHLKLLSIICTCLLLIGCGSNKKNYHFNLLSDPLGAYALMQIKYKENEQADWIFLGTTPIDINKPIVVDNAVEVSLKVIRPGFYEQVKTWRAKDFKKEHKAAEKIFWVPNMVKQ